VGSKHVGANSVTNVTAYAILYSYIQVHKLVQIKSISTYCPGDRRRKLRKTFKDLSKDSRYQIYGIDLVAGLYYGFLRRDNTWSGA